MNAPYGCTEYASDTTHHADPALSTGSVTDCALWKIAKFTSGLKIDLLALLNCAIGVVCYESLGNLSNMMKLSTMQAVAATVDVQWESDLADELLRAWEHDGGRAKFWRASTNFVFFFKKAGCDHVLRFNHVSERTIETIGAEIDYVNALADRGLPVARPVYSLAGKYVESITTSQGLFHAVVFEALPGKSIDLEELTPDQMVRWGKALGELHNAATQYTQSGRPRWQDHLAMVADIVPATETSAHQALARLTRALHQLDSNAQNFGLIHYDFEPDNLIWDGGQPGIIDFDDCAWVWYVADIALALSDLFDDRPSQVDFQNAAYRHFIQGYRTVRSIEQAELDQIPLFISLQNLFTFARLYRAMTPVNPAGELPWMAGLRDKLAAKMQFHRTEFAKS
jgi:Ser/Thr protein kinase RdoA (MazF antagonist)